MSSEEAAFRSDLARRLRCAEGHLRAVAGMVAADDDCRAVLLQVRAVQGALREITRRLARRRLADCLAAGRWAPGRAERERALRNIRALYELILSRP